MSSDLQEGYIERADALWDVWNDGERLILFQGSPSGYDFNYSEIPFDSVTGSGYVKSGKVKERRRFEKGGVTETRVTVFPSRRYPGELLKKVQAYAIVKRDRGTGLWTGQVTLCQPDGGVPHTTDEIAYRWFGGQGIQDGYTAGDWAISPDGVDPLAYVNSAGEPYLNSAGDAYVGAA
jgi:hypothetical protein